MGRFIGRWLGDAIRLALSLGLAIALMQVPALTHEYAVALLQVSDGARRDIDQRKASAEAFYHLTDTDDAAVVTALQAKEPSNAATLAQAVDHARALRSAYDAIEAAPPLLQPVAAISDILADRADAKMAVLRTTCTTYVPQFMLSTAAAIYGLIGLVLGSFVAQVLISILGGMGRRRASALGNGSPWR